MATSPTSMSAAAAQYQESLAKYQPRRSSSTSATGIQPHPNGPSASLEADIKQEHTDQAATTTTIPTQTSTPAAIPAVDTAASTPTRQVNGTQDTKPAATAADAASAIPQLPAEHGAPFRRYVNSKVTPSLLEGMKRLGLTQPKDPLKFLGEFLLQRSRELEGT